MKGFKVFFSKPTNIDVLYNVLIEVEGSEQLFECSLRAEYSRNDSVWELGDVTAGIQEGLPEGVDQRVVEDNVELRAYEFLPTTLTQLND